MRFIILSLAIISYGCEEFTGYNYDSDFIAQNSHIYGKVFNAFHPYQPVKNARIEFGYLTFFTDSLGAYDITYILSVDDNRNKPIEVLVSAADYHDLVTELIIEIPEQKVDLELEYGAPKIERIWVGVPEEVYHQVIVTDNQGIDNIQSVRTTFYYSNINDPLIKTRTAEMIFIGHVPGSSSSAYYQAIQIPTYGEGWTYEGRWINFVVQDKDGFSDTVTKRYADIMSPYPLFTVE